MVTLPVLGTSESYTIAPHIIIGVGLNYREHIAEHRSIHAPAAVPDIPDEPIIFSKTPNVLVGPDEPIILPGFMADYGFATLRVDYEAELAVIIGRQARNICAEQAFDYVFGYTCMNDVSQRNLQKNDVSGWFRGKSIDTFGPVGPVVVRHKDMGDPQALDIECRLNGAVVQSSNTRHMIFPIPALIAFITRHITLTPGDMITTGTPAGVGAVTDGDTVEITIEGIGTLRNPVAAE